MKKNHLQRREFIKKSAMAGTLLAGGGALAGAQTGTKASSRSGKGDIIKIGLIGCGGRGGGAAVQALAAHEGNRLVAVCDVFEDKIQPCLERVKENHPDQVDVPKKRQFTGFEGYLGLIDEVDVVLQVTPPGFRPLHAEAAVRAGKHIFMEKPVATDVAGCKKLKEVERMANEKGLYVTVGFNSRYSQDKRDFIKLLRDGAIGDVVGMSGLYLTDYLGKKIYSRTPEMTEMTFQMRNWYYFNWLSGDQLVEQTIHRIDALAWIKQDYPVQAQGTGGREVRGTLDWEGEIYDHHTVEYTYADGSKAFVLDRQIPGTWKSGGRLNVVGTNGFGEFGKSITPKDGEKVNMRRDTVGGHQREHDEMYANILAGKTNNDLSHSIPSTMMAIIGLMASYCGKVVTWDEAWDSGQDLRPASVIGGSPMTWDTLPVPSPAEDGTYPAPIPGVTPPW